MKNAHIGHLGVFVEAFVLIARTELCTELRVYLLNFAVIKRN